jgi:gas vesicle protein
MKPRKYQEINMAKKMKLNPEIPKEKIESKDVMSDQYNVIRKDVLKLREDLSHAYDLIKKLMQNQQKKVMKAGK